MNVVSFTHTPSFKRSLFNTGSLPLPDKVPVEPAFAIFKECVLNEIDPILQTTFKELIEYQFSRKLDYFIVIDEDENGLCHLSDGFSFLKNYWAYNKSESVLSRKKINNFAVYRFNYFDSTQKMHYFCSKNDIDSDKGYLKHIEAHFPKYDPDLRANAFCDIAQEYLNGKSVFGKNEKESYAWYKRAALTFEEAQAFTCLAILKRKGLGTKSSHEKSTQYFQKALEKSLDAKTCYLFADALKNGIGTPPNPTKALYWYEMASKLGCPEANKEIETLKSKE